MQLVEILIDRRVVVNFIDDKSTENIIFCRPLEESLHNIATISTKKDEFIHEIITESTGDRYIVTDICLPTGESYNNVRFKLLFTEEAEMPCSTINLSSLGKPRKLTPLPDVNISVPSMPHVPVILEERTDRNVIPTRAVTVDYKSQAKELESKYEKQRIERIESEKKQKILEFNKAVQTTLENYKTELLKEYYSINEKQKEVFEITIDNKLAEKFENNTTHINSLLIERANEIQNLFSEKIIAELQRYKENIQKEIETINKTVKTVIDDQYSIINIETSKLLVERSDELSKKYNKELSETLADYKMQLFSDFSTLSESVISSAIAEKMPGFDNKIKDLSDKVVDIINEKKDLTILAKSAKEYTDKAVAAASYDAKEYARRILELGGGGGTVAVQYAEGGTMNGILNVTGQYLSAGVDLASLFSNSSGGKTQLLSFNDQNAALTISDGNTVSLSALSAAGGTGDANVNSLVRANSANWQSVYTTVYANSASWLYTLPVATTSVLGGVKVGSGLTIDGTGTIATTVTSGSNVQFNNVTTTGQIIESFQTYNTNISASGSATLNCTGGNIWNIVSTVSGNWLVSLTGLNININQATNTTLIINQGSTAFIPTSASINGIASSINWQSGFVPVGNAGKKDIISFSILQTGINNYLVFGQLVTFG